MTKARVTGIGGIFFKSADPAGLADWYRRHLGFDIQPWGGAVFSWNRHDTGTPGYTVWSPFKETTEYFQPSTKPYMINLRVNDLDAVLDALRTQGVGVLDRREDAENGRFGYVLDPEGTLLELWEPASNDPAFENIPP